MFKCSSLYSIASLTPTIIWQSQDCCESNDNLVITHNFWISWKVLRLFCYCLFLIRQDHGFGSISTQTLSVAGLALFLVAFTRATLVVLYRSENGKPLCLAELSPCTNIGVVDRNSRLECLSHFTTSNPTFWRFWANKTSTLHPTSPSF